MISNESIDRIFETARIEEVIADFVTLKKAGSSFKGLSPFVNEKTPSFIVSPAKQIYKDFSSGKGGNVVSFLMEHEHYSYPEALKWLAQRYNIEIEETGQTDAQKQKRSEKESLYLVNEFANKYFQNQLWNSEEGKSIGLSYFKERGFTEETIKEFQLGYSPNEYEALTNAAQKEQYSLEFLVKSGVTKEGNGRTTDRFRGRVMFPILSHTGRVLGFGGRTLMKDAKIAKYLNSPESEIYHKSKTLYGIFQAKNELSKQDNCLLVEGYTDVISLNQAGVKNVVASSGTSLTKDQIVLIKRYTKNVTILYDGDSAGIKASLRGIDMILEEGLSVQVLLFPDGEDPDSFAKKVSSTELTDYINEEKQDFLRFKAALLLKEAGHNPLEKSKAARDIVESIAVIPDALQRNAYIQECAHVLQMQERILFTELAQVMKNVAVRQEKEQQREEKASARLQVVENEPAPSALDIGATQHYEQERSLCWLLLNYGQHLCTFHDNHEGDEEDEDYEPEQETVAEYIVSELAMDEISFNNVAFNEILQSFTHAFDEHGQILNSDHFVRKEGSTIVNVVVDLVTEKHELHDWKRQKVYLPEKTAFVKNYTIQSVLRYKEKRISDLIRQIQTDLKNADNVAEELVRKIETFNKLNALRAQIDKELNRVV